MKKYAFIFAVTLTMIAVLSPTTVYADKENVLGYYIDKNGSNHEVMIRVHKEAMGKKLSEVSYQNGFYYINKSGKKTRLSFGDVSEFGFSYMNEKFVFRYVPKKGGLDILGPFYKGVFCRLLIDGPCELYSIMLQRSSGTASFLDSEYVIYKNKEDVFLTKTGIRKMAMGTNKLTLESLFSDCADLVAKIENDEFKEGDDKYRRMVTFYNSECRDTIAGEESDAEEE